MVRLPTANSTYKKLAVQCSADNFVVNQSLVLRINICRKNRQLLIAAKRYKPFMRTKKYRIIRNISILILCLGLLTIIYNSVNGYFSFSSRQFVDSYNKSTQQQLDEFNDRQIYYEELNKQIALENYDNALRVCLSRIKEQPTETIFIYNDIGELYNSKGDLDSAIFYFSKAIQAKVSYVGAYANRGWTYYRKDLYVKAEQDLNIAAKLNYDYYFALGIVQEKIDKNRAVESYKNFILNHKDNLECKQRLDSLTKAIKNGL